jgi:uroporphyrinogen-III synthase
MAELRGVALQGIAVLVTRPERQAAPLCELLAAEGAQVVRLPALQIRAVDPGLGREPVGGPFAAADFIIFTSANAVHFGAWLIDGQSAAALAAIGPATARALRRVGLAATVTPEGGFDSEHLLRHPRLQHPQGRRVLIVKGRQGRELLRESLLERGATVEVAEVYERVRADYSGDELATAAAKFAAGGIGIITATSVDVATALLDIATPTLRRECDRAHWLVPGERIAAALRARGVTAPFIHADSAEDHDLLAAIVRWRSRVSGA